MIGDAKKSTYLYDIAFHPDPGCFRCLKFEKLLF